MAKSTLEKLMELQIMASELPPYNRELMFHPKRRWRFDFAWKKLKIALEVQGGTFNSPCGYCKGKGWIFTKGRRYACTTCDATGQRAGAHTSGKGYHNDCEKYNEATILGWHILQVTRKMIEDGTALAFLRRLFEHVTHTKQNTEVRTQQEND